MPLPESFEAASKAAEYWVNAVSLIADHGRRNSVNVAFRSLAHLEVSYRQHADTIYEAKDELAALSDGPVKWEHGRGLSAIAGSPEHVFPHIWSSAHEAAEGIARLALELLISDVKQGRALARELLASRWKALVITIDESATLQERIRRERAKILAGCEWSEAKSPSEWCKELRVSLTTLKRHVNQGKLIVRKLTSRSWSVRIDTLRSYVGGK